MIRFAFSLFFLVVFFKASFAQPSVHKNTIFKTPLNNVNPNTTQVRGFITADGTYVPPYERTSRNSTNWDNYSTTNNTNPNTQKQGSRAKDYTPDTYNYGQGKAIYEGPKGGQYYINDSGKKVYVPKRN